MENQEIMNCHKQNNEKQEVEIFGKSYAVEKLDDIRLKISSMRYSNQTSLRVHIRKIDPDELEYEDLVAFQKVMDGEWQEGNDEFKQYQEKVNSELMEKYSSDNEIIEDSRNNMLMMLFNHLVLKGIEKRKAQKKAQGETIH